MEIVYIELSPIQSINIVHLIIILYNVHLNTVEMLQKKVIRIITGSEYLAHTNDLFLKAKILKLFDLHEYLLLLYFF